MTKANPPEGGYMIHFLASMTVVLKGGVIPSGRVMNYGDELAVTEEIRALNTDRNGVTWLSLLDDSDGQARRWGRPVIARGPWPDGKSKLLPGSAEWNDEREGARQAAHRIEDDRQRAEALARVRVEFGAMATSRTLATYKQPVSGG